MNKMGKVSSTTSASKSRKEMKRKKKKGRPSLTDLHKPQSPNSNNKIKKTLPPFSQIAPPSSPPSNSASFEDDDEDERTQKKVKLVVRLPKTNNDLNQSSDKSGSGSGDSDIGGDARSGDPVFDQEEKVSKATGDLHGSQLDSGPTTPLPDKKLLVFILDRLQKKDTYGVFSEPVDANELPDYHEIIEQPIDFGTVRKKLDGRAYTNLEELEADILLICSNAMQYNAPDTVYHRQARTIQEIARRDFANLRHEGDDGEPQPKVVRRGRPPGKTQKKHLEKSLLDRIGPDISSDVTLASGEEKVAAPSSSYSLRKTSSLNRYRSADGFVTPNRSSLGENGSDWSIDFNNEFPASILRADLKHGNKNVTVDVTKRDTYREYHPPDSENDLSGLMNIDGNMKRLMPVGLNFAQHSYARSLAKFAANLGPVAWKAASRKIESVLPAGVKFGPGWVGETEAPPELLPSFSAEKQKSPSHLQSDLHTRAQTSTSSTTGLNTALHQSISSEQMVEAVRRLNSQNEVPVQSGACGVQGWPHQALQKSIFHPSRNGFSGLYGQSPSELGISSPAVPTVQSGPQEGLTPHQRPGIWSNDASSSVYPASSHNNRSFEESKFSHSLNMLVQGKAPDSITEAGASHPGKPVYEHLSAEQKPYLPIPPDLNVRIPGPSSPSSRLVAITDHQGYLGEVKEEPGSSQQQQQQPDLALQL